MNALNKVGISITKRKIDPNYEIDELTFINQAKRISEFIIK